MVNFSHPTSRTKAFIEIGPGRAMIADLTRLNSPHAFLTYSLGGDRLYIRQVDTQLRFSATLEVWP